MGTKTNNYNLIKPAPEDFYNIQDYNENMDIIDGQLKEMESELDVLENDYVRQPGYGVTDGSSNTYTLVLSPAPTTYKDGMGVVVKMNVANSGACTLNVNGLGAKAIVDSKGNALTAGKLRVNGIYSLRYDGTDFVLLGEAIEGSGSKLDADLLDGKEASAFATAAQGTKADAAATQTSFNAHLSDVTKHKQAIGITQTGDYSNAEGSGTRAIGNYSHAEGYCTTTSGFGSHSEGRNTLACDGKFYTITGFNDANKTITLDKVSELLVGDSLYITVYSSLPKHDIIISAINELTVTLNTVEIINSDWIYAVKLKAFNPSHAEGDNTISCGVCSHAEGYNTKAINDYCHTEGYGTTSSGYCSHAEGDKTTASGYWSHAEGYGTTASGQDSHAEGLRSIAMGDYSHTEGKDSKASGESSHAEGYATKANGDYSHSEGYCTTASNAASHSEGYVTSAIGEGSHSEGRYSLSCNGELYKITAFDDVNKSITLDRVSGLSVGDSLIIKVTGSPIIQNIKILSINNLTIILNTTITIQSSWKSVIKEIGNHYNSHAEGVETIAAGYCSHAEGAYSEATGSTSHAEGYSAVASGNLSHAEGMKTIASGGYSHTEGYETTASASYSHAEGNATKAGGNSSHAEGSGSNASGNCSHAEGAGTNANGGFSHAEGYCTTAFGESSHAEGSDTTSSGSYSHTEGYFTSATGNMSHAEGDRTTASGYSSHAGGYYTIANNMFSQAIGKFNKTLTGNPASHTSTTDAFVIGNGTADDARSNAFRVTFDGKTYGLSAFNSAGADYAEFFEWADGNIDNEDRVGYFVTLDGDKIRKANSADDYILGIISVNPSVIGDNYADDWSGKYVTDEWGRIQYHNVVVPATYRTVHHAAVYEENTDKIITDAYDEEVIISEERTDYVPKLNPDWDSSQEYISREKRKEWSAVGMMGKLLVRDDGTCQVNGFCKPNNDGIATTATNGYRVMKRVSEEIIQILVK